VTPVISARFFIGSHAIGQARHGAGRPHQVVEYGRSCPSSNHTGAA